MKKSQVLVLFMLALSNACLNEDIPRNPTATVDPNLCKESTLKLVVSASANASGCGKEDGSITVSATGGKAPYQYSLNGGATQSSNVFSNLGGGTYSVTVYDATPCSYLLNNISISQGSSTLAMGSPQITPDSGCLTSNGAVKLIATGGVTPYSFSFNGSAFTTTATYTALKAGTYSASIKDNAGCSIDVSVTIPKVTSVSYANFIAPLIIQTCAGPGSKFATCHQPGTAQVDLTVYANVFSEAAKIKSKTADGSMPKPPKPGGSLTADQIKQIACWVDEGAQNN